MNPALSTQTETVFNCKERELLEAFKYLLQCSPKSSLTRILNEFEHNYHNFKNFTKAFNPRNSVQELGL